MSYLFTASMILIPVMLLYSIYKGKLEEAIMWGILASFAVFILWIVSGLKYG
ncbi:hypothetical protein [Novosphingobium fuchskuhlense]|uniref:hypothetical protein n=1 Tax=Novosphingobium fuchskuhlense TaxID=1117702 RepID=UPI000B0F98C4|nr:hypothetical protein [Novosphingobium fuchskuhlense]